MSDVTSLKEQLKSLNLEYAKIKDIPQSERKAFGVKLNERKQDLLAQIAEAEAAAESENIEPIDITAPAAPNQPIPTFKKGSKHPLMTELDRVIDIYSRMGFNVMESYQLDDEFHMFESLNFPDGHPHAMVTILFALLKVLSHQLTLPPCSTARSYATKSS